MAFKPFRYIMQAGGQEGYSPTISAAMQWARNIEAMTLRIFRLMGRCSTFRVYEWDEPTQNWRKLDRHEADYSLCYNPDADKYPMGSADVRRRIVTDMNRPSPQWLSAMEYAQHWGIPVKQVYSDARKGAMKYVQVNGQKFYDKAVPPPEHRARGCPPSRWARDYACCVQCRGVESEHNGKGLCKACYIANMRGRLDRGRRKRTHKEVSHAS